MNTIPNNRHHVQMMISKRTLNSVVMFWVLRLLLILSLGGVIGYHINQLADDIHNHRLQPSAPHIVSYRAYITHTVDQSTNASRSSFLTNITANGL